MDNHGVMRITVLSAGYPLRLSGGYPGGYPDGLSGGYPEAYPEVDRFRSSLPDFFVCYPWVIRRVIRLLSVLRTPILGSVCALRSLLHSVVEAWGQP